MASLPHLLHTLLTLHLTFEVLGEVGLHELLIFLPEVIHIPTNVDTIHVLADCGT